MSTVEQLRGALRVIGGAVDDYMVGRPAEDALGEIGRAVDAALTMVSHAPAAEYLLTFGVRYAIEPHPTGALWIHPDGWVSVVAPSYGEARRVVCDLFGLDWCDLYEPEQFTADLFPRGELLRVVVPPGVVETEDHRD